jgi:hypothetical protein
MHLCSGCTEHLETDLREVDSMVEALWASAAKFDAGCGSVGKSGHTAPTEPTNSRAYDTGRTLNVILTGWARAIGHREPHAVKAANVLLTQIREVRGQDWAPVLKEELRGALNDCRRAMDRKGPRVFAGICPTSMDGQDCNTPVYTPQGKTDARCQTCGATWDLTEWRGRAIKAAGHHTGTAVEISRILSDPVTMVMFPQNKISVWVNRKVLAPIGHRDGKPVYQVRKVRNLWGRAIIESAARSEHLMLAKTERQRVELEAARAERIAA